MISCRRTDFYDYSKVFLTVPILTFYQAYTALYPVDLIAEGDTDPGHFFTCWKAGGEIYKTSLKNEVQAKIKA